MACGQQKVKGGSVSRAIQKSELSRGVRKQQLTLERRANELERTVEERTRELREATRVIESPLKWLMGPSQQMQKVVQQIRQVADSPLTTLVEGETGTGKELVARAIHHLSARRQEAVYRRRLRRDPGYPDRVGTLRLRERRVHRRRSAKGGAIPACRGRKPLSRRDYQSSPRHASEALARAAGTAGAAAWQQAGAPCERSDHRRLQCSPRARGAGGAGSPTTFLPPLRVFG